MENSVLDPHTHPAREVFHYVTHIVLLLRERLLNCLATFRRTYNTRGTYQWPHVLILVPKPLVGGAGAVGRITALGPDALSLEIGQLVYADCAMRARDEPDEMFLSAIHEGDQRGARSS
jgi:hypothetical protein